MAILDNHKKNRHQTNHDQSKVSVLTKIEFDVHPLEFASDDLKYNDNDELLESELEGNKEKPGPKNKNKGNFIEDSISN